MVNTKPSSLIGLLMVAHRELETEADARVCISCSLYADAGTDPCRLVLHAEAARNDRSEIAKATCRNQ